MSLSELPPETLCLILKSLDSHDDLRRVCSVSKSFDILATPLLYRSVIFRRPSSIEYAMLELRGDDDLEKQDVKDNLSFSIFYRLLDDRNEVLRAFVHRITVEDLNISGELLARRKFKGQNLLAELVKKLPNLEAMYFKRPLSFPMSEEFAEAFLTHKRSPKLSLHGECGHTPTKITMPFIQEIRTSIDATASSRFGPRDFWGRMNYDDPDAERLALHDLFSAYPNIESLSVSINRLHSGCDGGSFPSTRITSLAPETTFPPLKSLSLSGYNVAKDQKGQRIWTKRFPWDKLTSLSLGPQDNPGFFKAATRKVRHLEQFKITSYGDTSSDEDLDVFLSSFHTLKSLTAKGTVPSLAALSHHSDLEHLCLHAVEQCNKERVSLSAREIKALHRQHPHLKSLKLDINPHGKWPNDIVKAIATSFNDLRQLSIHVGLRLPHLIKICEADTNDDDLGFNEEAFKTVLTNEKAQDFAKIFFACRGPSRLEKITLRTGEALRHFPQWHPFWADAESTNAKRFEVYPPRCEGDEPRLHEIMNHHFRYEQRLATRFAGVNKPQHLSRAPRIIQASGFPSVI